MFILGNDPFQSLNLCQEIFDRLLHPQILAKVSHIETILALALGIDSDITVDTPVGRKYRMARPWSTSLSDRLNTGYTLTLSLIHSLQLVGPFDPLFGLLRGGDGDEDMVKVTIAVGLRLIRLPERAWPVT